MKRYGNLYNQLVSFENLLSASRKARVGKRTKMGCATFEMYLEDELLQIQQELLDKSYQPGAYREFTLYDRKPRKISAAPYRDRVVHHALCNILEPIFEKSFIYDSYACRPGKGTHAAVDRFTEFARKYRYVLKTDIRKYFPSIDHDLLYQKITSKIKCPETIWLTKIIIDGSNKQDYVDEYYRGDTLLTPIERRKGIPIGNLTSQFFANIYLNNFDHFSKEQLGCKAYIRYVDDIAVFSDDKRELWHKRDRMAEYLEKDRLRLHPYKTFVLPVAEGVDHLGYRVFPDHRKVRKDICYRFRKKYAAQRVAVQRGEIPFAKMNATVQSWIGHARHADSYRLRKSLFSCYFDEQ